MMMYEREDINEILLNNARAMLHLNEKKMAAKIRKRERKNKKDRTTDAPVVVVVPRGIFPFPFQRRALLRSRDPHNVLVLCCLLLFIVVLIIVVIILCGVLCLPNQNRLKNEKTEKKSFAGEMSIFKPSSSSLYIIHNAQKKRE